MAEMKPERVNGETDAVSNNASPDKNTVFHISIPIARETWSKDNEKNREKSREYYQTQLSEQANRQNKRRSFIKKAFGTDAIDALDIAHKEATNEDAERETENHQLVENAAELKDALIESFEILFDSENGRAFIEDIENHVYQCVVSEDATGRVPAEIMLSVINTRYNEHGQPTIPLIGIGVGKEMRRPPETLVERTKKLIENGVISSGIGLYVTEHVSSTGTVRTFLEIIDKATADDARKKQTPAWDCLAMSSTGHLEGRIMNLPSYQGFRRVIWGETPNFGAGGLANMLGELAGVARSSGKLGEPVMLLDTISSPRLIKIRQSLIEEVSQKVMQSYKERITG